MRFSTLLQWGLRSQTASHNFQDVPFLFPTIQLYDQNVVSPVIGIRSLQACKARLPQKHIFPNVDITSKF